MDEMTTAELNQYLENIAKLIESTAKDPEAAAKNRAGQQGQGIKSGAANLPSPPPHTPKR